MRMLLQLHRKRQKIGQLLLVAQVEFYKTQQFSVFWLATSLVFCNNEFPLLTFACEKKVAKSLPTEAQALSRGSQVAVKEGEEELEVLQGKEWRNTLEAGQWIWRGDKAYWSVEWAGAWGTQDANLLEYSLNGLCCSQNKLGYLFPPQQTGGKLF